MGNYLADITLPPQYNTILIQAISFCKKAEKAVFLTTIHAILSQALRQELPACHKECCRFAT